MQKRWEDSLILPMSFQRTTNFDRASFTLQRYVYVNQDTSTMCDHHDQLYVCFVVFLVAVVSAFGGFSCGRRTHPTVVRAWGFTSLEDLTFDRS